MIGYFFQDARGAFRSMLKRAAMSAVSILSLAIGLGANATIFSFVNALRLRPLPLVEPNRLVEVWHHREKSSNGFMSYMTPRPPSRPES
jgi:hypothetical protein